MCPVTASRSPGPNSCTRFIPASLPTVEPKSPIGAELERNQYGREALWAATDVSTPTRYEAFNRRLPVSSRVTRMLDAASVARPIHLSFDEARYREFGLCNDATRNLLRESPDSF